MILSTVALDSTSQTPHHSRKICTC